MRLSRFYIEQPLKLGQQHMPEAVAHYMNKVLRLPIGAQVQLFDGSGFEFIGTIVNASKKQLSVLLEQRITGLACSPLEIHLGQGLSRGERMDWVVQKATELGVSSITPLWSEHCEVRLDSERAEKRRQHWQQIAISACEQCGRTKVPQILPPTPLAHWQQQIKSELKLVLHPDAVALGSHAKPSSLALLIGPEGGLSEDEVTAAQQHGFVAASFGPRVLRTETAPVVALSAAQLLWGDLA